MVSKASRRATPVPTPIHQEDGDLPHRPPAFPALTGTSEELQLDSRLDNENLDRLEQDHEIEQNAAGIDVLHIQRDAHF
jgi:hypothetical protein